MTWGVESIVFEAFCPTPRVLESKISPLNLSLTQEVGGREWERYLPSCVVGASGPHEVAKSQRQARLDRRVSSQPANQPPAHINDGTLLSNLDFISPGPKCNDSWMASAACKLNGQSFFSQEPLHPSAKPPGTTPSSCESATAVHGLGLARPFYQTNVVRHERGMTLKVLSMTDS